MMITLEITTIVITIITEITTAIAITIIVEIITAIIITIVTVRMEATTSTTIITIATVVMETKEQQLQAKIYQKQVWMQLQQLQ